MFMLLHWNKILGVPDLVHRLNATEHIINVLVGHKKMHKILLHVIVNIKLCLDGGITKKNVRPSYNYCNLFLSHNGCQLNKDQLLLTRACSI